MGDTSPEARIAFRRRRQLCRCVTPIVPSGRAVADPGRAGWASRLWDKAARGPVGTTVQLIRCLLVRSGMMLSPIPDDLVELIARRFRLLSEPMRIRLVDRLRDGEATVHQLADELGTSEQNVSRHLTPSAEAGVLARRKQGNRVYYRIADPEVLALWRAGLWVGRAPPAGAGRAGAGPVGQQLERSLR